MIRKVKILGWEFEQIGEPDCSMQLVPVSEECPLLILTHWEIPYAPPKRFCIFYDFDVCISKYRFTPDFEAEDWSDVYLGVLEYYKEHSEILLEILDRAGVKTK